MAENTGTKKILLFGLALAVIISSFYILDFKVAHSKTRTNSRVGAYSSGDPMIDYFPSRIYLYVEGDDSISRYLNESLEAELEKAGMEVSVTGAVEEKYDSQALFVNVSRDGFYTPVYASSDLDVLFFYTSTGTGTKYFEQFKEGNVSVIFENTGSGEGEKFVHGDMELQDSTKGLVSLKAYRKHLAEEAAKKTVEQLQQQINLSP